MGRGRDGSVWVGDNVAEHDEEVAGAAGEHKEVPEVVGVELSRPEVGAVGGEDQAPGGVEQAARQQPAETDGGKGTLEGTGGEEASQPMTA